MTISEAAAIMEVTPEAARKSLKKLVSANVLRQLPGVYPARFVADPILKAVNAEPTRR